MVLWLFYFALVCYNMLDIYQTNLLFQFGVFEGNFLIKFFMRSPTDIQTIIIIKMLAFVFLGTIVYIYNKKEKEKYEKLPINI